MTIVTPTLGVFGEKYIFNELVCYSNYIVFQITLVFHNVSNSLRGDSTSTSSVSRRANHFGSSLS